MSFKVEPNNYLGQDYADHCSRCYSLALSDPKSFYSARANVTQALKRKVVKDFYDKIYSVLSTGQIDSNYVYGTAITNADAAANYQVKYPTQKINEIALSFAATIDKMLDEIANIILPDKINRVVEEKLSNIGKSTLPI